ncbi:hypothetical protein [Polluticaenibacter yanchengensis]|uniref:DUF3996 domain-containing protein n=1 Tax=Polluticaenibacter yanchengensis TaxID=3014562 RepID=A0ABT4UN66_9BACT|nr:hypothetical protein [Chitinophagaceae bacterium LY-5]
MQNSNQFTTGILFFLLVLLSHQAFAQPTETYPKITGYASIMHPIVIVNKDHTTTNFDRYYQVVFPFGINIWKSKKIGFSIELAPGIKSEEGTSKMNNLLIHPGVLIALGKGFGFAGRVAFETSGRYGITPVFSKVVKKNKESAFYIAIPMPLRLGNNQPASLSAGFQIGISF